ncbi:TetR family transcriptional regulator [Georgenia sp. Z1344]|uniref:TetR/AcrR family transcriptional regulator n=1 Tax=Georgenia sp. Z1344 TaxID=3416706 RepID=UPI003CFA1AE4
MSSTSEDLSTRARLRDTAIRRFAAHGFDASLRSIAADAGVSAGLILHHFGSRAGLREACDDHVLARIRDSKTEILRGDVGFATALAQMAELDGYLELVAYVLRAMQTGGALTDHFLDALVTSSETYLADAVRDGIARPSRSPSRRARALSVMSLGALLLELPGHRDEWDLDEMPDMLRSYTDRMVLPLLEIYTEPLLTNSTLLDAYLDSPEGRRAVADDAPPPPPHDDATPGAPPTGAPDTPAGDADPSDTAPPTSDHRSTA